MSGDGIRLDKWLWQARFFKSRGLAGKIIEKGAVRIVRGEKVARLSKPAAPIRPGDQLVLRLGADPLRFTVLSLPDRRGPAPEAQASYSLVSDAE